MWFEGFTLEYAELRGQRIRLRRGGSGPPLLLLHGNPQTHAMWHKVAPALARRFTCYLPDIRGYGFSSKPPVSADHAAYAKRLAVISADAKKLKIVQEMSTLAEKETALAVSESGADLLAIHAKHSLWTGLPVLIIVLLGGFTTNFIWCLLLNLRNKTGYQYFSSKPGEQSPHYHAEAAGGEGAPAGKGAKFDGRHDKTPVPLLGNYIFSALAGITWYFQFFFYSMGETQMGQYKFSS